MNENVHPLFANMLDSIINPGMRKLSNDDAMEIFRRHLPYTLTRCYVSADGNMMSYTVFSGAAEVLKAAEEVIADYRLPLSAELMAVRIGKQKNLVIRYQK